MYVYAQKQMFSFKILFNFLNSWSQFADMLCISYTDAIFEDCKNMQLHLNLFYFICAFKNIKKERMSK